MYSYLYAVIGLSSFQILYPFLLMIVFKKRWFHIDDENGTLSKREVRNKMGKREYIFALPVSVSIFIINVVLFAYFVCTSQVKITLDEPVISAVSIILLLFIFCLNMSALQGTYSKTRKNIFGRPITHILKGRFIPLSVIIEDWKKCKWLNCEIIKNDAMSIYFILIFFNSFILIPILILY